MAKIDLSVIDQFFSAQLSANESEATLKALRPQVEEAVQALIEERGLLRNSPRRIPTPSPSNTVSPSPSWRKRKGIRKSKQKEL